MKIYSAAIDGLSLCLTEIEADISRGLPTFTIVGLGDTSIKEARDRIRAALKNSGYTFPMNRKIISLSPADIKKHGSHFDLPIALSMLTSSSQIRLKEPVFCAGELKLDGQLQKIPGILPLAHFALKRGFKKIFIPYENRKEASLIKGIQIYPIKCIRDLILFLEGKKQIPPYKSSTSAPKKTNKTIDFAEVKGHELPKRVLEIAASGNHHSLLVGPPGTGKTMLAKAFQGILPYLNEQNSMEVSMIYSITRNAEELPIQQKPFRQIHHSTTSPTLIGGGTPFKVGEATLAHKGVLFLDEFAEFKRQTLEELREPLQEGIIRIGRHGRTRILPSKFQLLAAMNPCPCGYYGDQFKNCMCTSYSIKNYYKKLSGPILDRIDLIIDVPRLPKSQYLSKSRAESSAEVQKRVVKTLGTQLKRGQTNNQLTMQNIKDICQLNKVAEEFIIKIIDRLHVSPRSYLSILRVARTIADMENSDAVTKDHIAEAVQYKKEFGY